MSGIAINFPDSLPQQNPLQRSFGDKLMVSSAIVLGLRSTRSEIDPNHFFETNFASRFTKLTRS